MSDRNFFELHKSDDEKDTFEYFSFSSKPVKPFVAKLIFWSTLIGGVAIGTLLFLFFLTLFIYFFIPLFLIVSAWVAFQYWRSQRMWKR